jgi:hypothetical protein
MIIPGFIIAWITFPGVVVHEIAHQLFCRWYGIKVVQVCYFRFGNPCGYVIHGPAKKPWHNVMTAIGPFFVNSVVGAIIGFPAVLRISWGGADVLDWIVAWLGISIAMHAFPSTGDAKSIWHTVKSPETPKSTKFFAVPIVGLIYVGALGSMFWLDAAWGVGLTLGLSKVIVLLVA